MVRPMRRSNRSVGTLEEAVGLWKTRWHVEQGDQQLKEDMDLDHFEGLLTRLQEHSTPCFAVPGSWRRGGRAARSRR